MTLAAIATLASLSPLSAPMVHAHQPAIMMASSPALHFALTAESNRNLFDDLSAEVDSADRLLDLRGGGARTRTRVVRAIEAPKESSKKKKSTEPDGPPMSKFGGVTPEGQSVIYMAMGMACHYLGYSLARSITVTLFTSASTGYATSPGAFPLAMAFVSPLSLLLLVGYGGVLERRGPRGALVQTTMFCASVLLAAAACIKAFAFGDATLFGVAAMKYVTGPLFVFRESYVQLLTSQYWSFFSSVLTPDQSAKWFAPITGLTSIASAASGVGLAGLARRVGLAGALACTSLCLLASLLFTERAYGIADKYGFTPTKKTKSMDDKGKNKRGKKNREAAPPSSGHNESLFIRARALFARVPILGALFYEILASQGLSTLLNVCFVTSLGRSIPNDTERAGWVGNFYALINIISMVLQFGVLPFLMQVVEPKNLWKAIPIISLSCTLFQTLHKNPTLYLVSGSLLVMKVLEYSARRMLDEMVYVPLDFESRFLGKEIIGVFGYRLGKSLMSLSLSALTSAFGSFDLAQLSIMCSLAAGVWVKTAWTLSSYVPTRTEAQKEYTSTHGVTQTKKGSKSTVTKRTKK